MSRDLALEMRDVTVRFADGDSELSVLDGVDLSIARGEVVVLTGASGSGKSTLLAVAGLLLRPNGGTVTVDGTEADFARRRTTELRRTAIGLIFQSSNLFPALTAREQLAFVDKIAGRSVDNERIDGLLAAVGMSERAGHRPAKMSGGERQRVGIARALMGKPALVLADEPTASLDAARGAAVFELLVEQAHAANVGCLIVTHGDIPPRGIDRRLHLDGGTLTELAPMGH